VTEDSRSSAATDHLSHADGVELPEPTAAPLTASVGIAVAALGIAWGTPFIVVGVGLMFVGIGRWVAELLPGRGHRHEPRVAPEARPAAISAPLGRVDRLSEGAPGYRFRLPEKIHPISAGIKGGIVGGVLMPIPALAYGLISGHGLWYTANLLTGLVLPGVGAMTEEQLEQFNPTLLLLAVVIHAVVSVTVGLIYGVLLPTLPSIPQPLAWGGLLMPILWSSVSSLAMGLVNPLLSHSVDWVSFLFSQFVFGVAAAWAVTFMRQGGPIATGVRAGLFGGALMPLPAAIWALSTGRSIWYPANLLAAIAYPQIRVLPESGLQAFQAEWLIAAAAVHLVMSIGFGLIYAALLPHVRPISTAFVWGGLVLPPAWTGMSYGLMGVVNPALQLRVDWPWFIASQFVFGIVAAIVVDRSEMVYIAPAGHNESDGPTTERPRP
jgi:hypothetical protein